MPCMTRPSGFGMIALGVCVCVCARIANDYATQRPRVPVAIRAPCVVAISAVGSIWLFTPEHVVDLPFVVCADRSPIYTHTACGREIIEPRYDALLSTCLRLSMLPNRSLPLRTRMLAEYNIPANATTISPCKKLSSPHSTHVRVCRHA